MYSSLTETEQMFFSFVEARFLGNSLAFYMKIPCLYICIQVAVAKIGNILFVLRDLLLVYLKLYFPLQIFYALMATVL